MEANVINLAILRRLSFSTVGVDFWWKQTHFSLSKVSLREGEPGRLWWHCIDHIRGGDNGIVTMKERGWKLSFLKIRILLFFLPSCTCDAMHWPNDPFRLIPYHVSCQRVLSKNILAIFVWFPSWLTFLQAPVCLATQDHAHFAQFSNTPVIKVCERFKNDRPGDDGTLRCNAWCFWLGS